MKGKGWHGDSKGHREARIRSIEKDMKFSSKDYKPVTTQKINKNEGNRFSSMMKNNSKSIVVSVYKWGEYLENITLDVADLKQMEVLSSDDLLGFDIRSQDEDKLFYAEANDIERSDDEGTGVKRSYATKVNVF